MVGVGGNLLFGAAGLLMSIPMLRRLHRRFGSWKAPAIATGVFVAMFSVSAFVVGPVISDPGDTDPPRPTETPTAPGHETHHAD